MLKIGSCCSGYLGLDLAVELLTGGQLSWVAEISPAAIKLIQHRRPGTPNLGDLTYVDWDHVEPVDIITAGWPCQPFSQHRPSSRREGLLSPHTSW